MKFFYYIIITKGINFYNSNLKNFFKKYLKNY